MRAAALAGLAITPLPASALIAGLRILGVEEGLPRLPDLDARDLREGAARQGRRGTGCGSVDACTGTVAPGDLRLARDFDRRASVVGHSRRGSWIPERSATRLREADLNVLSKLGNQDLEWRLEPKAFTGGEVRREDDLLDVLVGCPVDIQVARQPSP